LLQVKEYYFKKKYLDRMVENLEIWKYENLKVQDFGWQQNEVGK
jgi:hypothetical protein